MLAQDNLINESAPTWDEIRTASDELDQMACQTVLKACDVGDMLRAVRLKMDAESFGTHCVSELNRSKKWANQMIVLSFRRAAVLEALAAGDANDSIRSAYEHVKALPAPPDEETEREHWPRAKRGPNPGQGGRPKAVVVEPESQKISDAERAAIGQALEEGGQMIAEFAESQAEREQVKADLARRPDHQAAAKAYREIRYHLAEADRSLGQCEDLAFFDVSFWDAAMAHATRIVTQLEKLSCK